MAGTSATRKPAHRRFIGNGPGTENAASSQACADCVNLSARSAAGRVRGCCPLRHQVARRLRRWVRCPSACGADHVLTEASSGAPLPRAVPGGRIPPGRYPRERKLGKTTHPGRKTGPTRRGLGLPIPLENSQFSCPDANAAP